jgi:hypothetical protein
MGYLKPAKFERTGYDQRFAALQTEKVDRFSLSSLRSNICLSIPVFFAGIPCLRNTDSRPPFASLESLDAVIRKVMVQYEGLQHIVLLVSIDDTYKHQLQGEYRSSFYTLSGPPEFRRNNQHVYGGQADDDVNDAAENRHITKNRCDEVKVEKSYQSPVQSSYCQENQSNPSNRS